MNASPPLVLNGQAVSRETSERLLHFAALFGKWARTINLVAPSTLDQVWERHISDSAQLFQLSPSPRVWADLGSGGGFPGIVTAIFLAERGEGWVHLVESNHKKAAFLRTALLETGARGTVHPVRIADAPALVGPVDAISARALAELGDLFEMVAPWFLLNPQTRCFFHKGRDYRREIANTHGRWTFDLVEHASKVEAGSVILEVSGLTAASR